MTVELNEKDRITVKKDGLVIELGLDEALDVARQIQTKVTINRINELDKNPEFNKGSL